MADLTTTFAGLRLKSPVIAGSCGLTADVEKLQEMEKNGVGAVILKSVFEEQILMETQRITGNNDYPEEEDYLRTYVEANALMQHIDLVKAAKERLHIPVIASINCREDGDWVRFARRLEEAGADALELNVYSLPLDEFTESAETEKMYYDIVRHVKAQVRIPLIVKISCYFTNLLTFVTKLKAYGADAVTLFNRYYEPDIDIEREIVGAAPVFSNPLDIRATLRWTGIIAGKYPQLQISASTGVHSGEAVVKMLLAGATTVQVCSELYEGGIPVIGTMNRLVSSWMDRHSYRTIDEFRGKLSYADVNNAARYERAQFMKYFSDRDKNRE